MTVSYEKTILDEEITSRLLYIKDGIDVSEEAAAMESIQTVGSGGTFLLEDDTLEQMHDAWYPQYTDWNRKPEEIGDEDYTYVLRKANAQWKRRLEEAPESMLDEGTREALNDYIRKHAK